MKKKTKAVFKFKPFSKKQRKVLNWWTKSSPVKDADGIIADGAIRSGKTVSMSLSFVMWAMESFDSQNFAMCGKTVGSFRRNVWFWLKIMLLSRGYRYKDHKTENYIEISKNEKTNFFYIFGGKDEASQDLIQGITLAGIFFDEVALMPESFVNQGTGRCSIDDSKYWFNCNPDGPMHWFKVNWIDKSVGYLSKEQQNDLISKRINLKNILYLHFTMDDNLSLSEKIKQRYRNGYVGVFFKRYILGLWSIAEGAIFDMWSKENEITEQELPLSLKQTARRYISIDYGTTNPMVFLDIYDDGNIIWVTREYYYDSKVKMVQKTDKQYGDDLEEFIKHGPQPVAIILDPSAASFKSEMRNRGYRIKAADNEVLDGIRMTSTLIGQRKIKIVKANCRRTLSDILSYVWDEKAAQRGEEKPVKENDHGDDALRYFVKTVIRPRRLAR
ncbi:PBSX family phage terminase large subunit [Clostridium botulinum]|uniref:PBSX family phage terminase large subunit n=1 Tax=Clostridium botulinum TaxID=1491 RepID=UPI0013F03CDE|nr:PBSX family phage terminase large subunit [Clostridium botulinum]EGT5649312.1 PBSX family phage terminase large subunit [Clostridium botulinum]MBY6755506.1 PBSX family phage terminase large subunit [Clostridium botulinum]MBY6766433.1 PBSX family phage terminase large subunit [Clostridium botulinum]MBY6900363.1 PBSX family phage terminase large subunit [Clostridium botulinum]MBY6914638.1 PBSX family phage terminase large subunit [Clostridium botulinum]